MVVLGDANPYPYWVFVLYFSVYIAVVGVRIVVAGKTIDAVRAWRAHQRSSQPADARHYPIKWPARSSADTGQWPLTST